MKPQRKRLWYKTQDVSDLPPLLESSAVPGHLLLPKQSTFLALRTAGTDHLVDMVGTGSPEGQVQDALTRVAFLTKEEYERAVGAETEFNLETRV